ncbi:MAG: GDP-mannose 4,6-dehydratase [Spirochaetota bacterium]|nr:GDP-mannose 4,6-dehydratase [Spirochaetota bacterium]
MMKKKAFITGITGQDGAYLSEYLLNKGYRVTGLSHSGNISNLQYLGVDKDIELEKGSLADKDKIFGLIKSIKPDEVYHLGGMTAPGDSWNQVEEFTEINVDGSLYLLEAIKLHSAQAKFFNAATSEMFGNNHDNGWQTEETPFHPTNPYAVTKIYSYWMTNVYRDSFKLFCANGILFSHESPLRAMRFVTRKISDGVARIKLGLKDKIVLGNIESQRDWGFAGDYVEAIWLILQQDSPDNFIISSGKVHSIKEYLKLAFEHVGISNWEKYIEIDKKFFRPVDLTHLYGHSGKAKKILGWEAKTSFEEIVKMMVDSDLSRLQNDVKNKDS